MSVKKAKSAKASKPATEKTGKFRTCPGVNYGLMYPDDVPADGIGVVQFSSRAMGKILENEIAPTMGEYGIEFTFFFYETIAEKICDYLYERCEVAQVYYC